MSWIKEMHEQCQARGKLSTRVSYSQTRENEKIKTAWYRFNHVLLLLLPSYALFHTCYEDTVTEPQVRLPLG